MHKNYELMNDMVLGLTSANESSKSYPVETLVSCWAPTVGRMWNDVVLGLMVHFVCFQSCSVIKVLQSALYGHLINPAGFKCLQTVLRWTSRAS